MCNLNVDFYILEDGTTVQVGYNKASVHLFFDIHITFEQKARWVKDGHVTPEPDQSTFSGFLSRESVRVSLNYATTNDLTIYTCNAQNHYLQAPYSEKHYVFVVQSLD